MMVNVNRIWLMVGLLGIFTQIQAQYWVGTSFACKSSNITYLLRVEDRMNKEFTQNAALTYFQVSFQTEVKPILGVGYWTWQEKGQEYRTYQGLEYKGVRMMLEERFFENSLNKARARIRLQLKQDVLENSRFVISNELFFWKWWEHDRFCLTYQWDMGRMTFDCGYMYYYTNDGKNLNVGLISMLWNI
ncbi:MAG: hypothetical protein A2Y71_06180 [Bacteroidetes bacterium RBG_13_42_15]|nr:MAG: hypothetical protein A2Y71_06180 [Bacteroidetes bacterium RBG_13_42_15]